MLSEWRKVNFVNSHRISLKLIEPRARPATKVYTKFQKYRDRDCWTTALWMGEKKSLWGGGGGAQGPGFFENQKVAGPLLLRSSYISHFRPLILLLGEITNFDKYVDRFVCLCVCLSVCFSVCLSVCLSVNTLQVTFLDLSSSNFHHRFGAKLLDRQWLFGDIARQMTSKTSTTPKTRISINSVKRQNNVNLIFFYFSTFNSLSNGMSHMTNGLDFMTRGVARKLRGETSFVRICVTSVAHYFQQLFHSYPASNLRSQNMKPFLGSVILRNAIRPRSRSHKGQRSKSHMGCNFGRNQHINEKLTLHDMEYDSLWRYIMMTLANATKKIRKKYIYFGTFYRSQKSTSLIFIRSFCTFDSF